MSPGCVKQGLMGICVSVRRKLSRPVSTFVFSVSSNLWCWEDTTHKCFMRIIYHVVSCVVRCWMSVAYSPVMDVGGRERSTQYNQLEIAVWFLLNFTTWDLPAVNDLKCFLPAAMWRWTTGTCADQHRDWPEFKIVSGSLSKHYLCPVMVGLNSSNVDARS